ncbi:MAG: hypothetical protein B6229_09735 [Spirochaetaceae bacterium 4572_7]|nr:MAG: hypothetical protein B6229_09735 [Spirochaetaceae bacterium 4572_7]
MKFFNTAGPVNRPEHYKIDPLTRWDLDEILMLILQEKYFILHAPRQTGKTSSLLALRDYLNKGNDYFALYINVEVGQAERNNIENAMEIIVSEISSRVNDTELKGILSSIQKEGGAKQLKEAIEALSAFYSKPVVLFIDEIDALIGDTLLSVLRQIRSGYDKRPSHFPSSIVLCGVRDIKDYRIQTENKEIITGGSAFNIKAKSLTIGNFTPKEVAELFTQHVEETGQSFESGVYKKIYDKSGGQPWLVNAIGYELTYEMKENRNREVSITLDMVDEAINRIILSRATHLDQLADKLKEDRVRRIIAPMILGEESNPVDDDIQYCIDLGLIKRTPRGLEVSNPIYKEIIPRELTLSRQESFMTRFAPDWLDDEGLIDTNRLFTMFTDFWRENSDIWGTNIAGYHEAAPQLVFQAFLQRVANGKGFIAREFGLGRKRTDIMLKWRSSDRLEIQKIVVEIKILTPKDSLESVITKALTQTAEYSDIVGSTENHILIFDRDEVKKEWREKLFKEQREYNGESFTIWGC